MLNPLTLIVDFMSIIQARAMSQAIKIPLSIETVSFSNMHRGSIQTITNHNW